MGVTQSRKPFIDSEQTLAAAAVVGLDMEMAGGGDKNGPELFVEEV